MIKKCILVSFLLGACLRGYAGEAEFTLHVINDTASKIDIHIAERGDRSIGRKHSDQRRL